jgi:nitrite reductase (NADH) small subunit
VSAETDLGERRWVPLIAHADLPKDGAGVTVELEDRRLAVFALEEGVHVIDDECPHQGASLGAGIVLDGEVTCPWHGWHFRLSDGRNTDGMASCVAVFDARISASGWVEAALPTTRPAS